MEDDDEDDYSFIILSVIIRAVEWIDIGCWMVDEGYNLVLPMNQLSKRILVLFGDRV